MMFWQTKGICICLCKDHIILNVNYICPLFGVITMLYGKFVGFVSFIVMYVAKGRQHLGFMCVNTQSSLSVHKASHYDLFSVAVLSAQPTSVLSIFRAEECPVGKLSYITCAPPSLNICR